MVAKKDTVDISEFMRGFKKVKIPDEDMIFWNERLYFRHNVRKTTKEDAGKLSALLKKEIPAYTLVVPRTYGNRTVYDVYYAGHAPETSRKTGAFGSAKKNTKPSQKRGISETQDTISGVIMAKTKKSKSKVVGKYGYKGASYGGDPHWLPARFDGLCKKCGKKVKKGDRIFYYPKGKSAYCETCGKLAEKDFRNMTEAEDYYGGRY